MLNHTRKGQPIDHEKMLNELGVDPARFGRQVNFLLEIDKLKTIVRQTYLTDTSRRENSAEHSWHIALAAMVFGEYARDRDIDITRVIQMLLVHDLIEIDAGDTYCYDEDAKRSKEHREQIAAERIFGLLPEDQADKFRQLWNEFEAFTTPESRFANALDRYQPFLHNYFTDGKSWQENSIQRDQVFKRMAPVNQGSHVLWDHVSRLLELAVEKRLLDR